MLRHRHTLTIASCIGIAIVLALSGAVSAQSQIDMTVNYVEGIPMPKEVAYQVNAYVSVTDASGSPIAGLAASNFEVVEDASRVEIESVSPASNSPIAVIIAIDTSGSMIASEAGTSKIAAVREAASQFVNRLGADDQVAVLSFDTTIHRTIELTNNHNAAQQQIQNLQAITDAGTCLYDAAYEAGIIAATLPQGRRAILLLTDGIDELGGKTCSTHTLDDVINFASANTTRVPIYALGVGARTDPQSLGRLASLTGGRYLPAPTVGDVGSVFQRVTDQIKSQYVITYRSHAGQGPHTLIVTVDQDGVKDQDSRNFLLPNLPPIVSIKQPANGQNVSGQIKIVATLAGVGEVARVGFEVNGKPLGTDDTAPYEFDWDSSGIPPGAITVSAVAYDKTGAELSRDQITVVIPPPATATPTPSIVVQTQVVTAVVTQPGASTPASSAAGSMAPILFASLLFAIAVAGVGFVVYRARQRRTRTNGDGYVGHEHVTMDGLEPLAKLRILESDTQEMVGKTLDILSLPKKIGRGADNDFIIPDKPVSRHHAMFEARGSLITIREVESPDEYGLMKRPKFGTFVDDEPIGLDPVPLRHGNRIRLGKRVVLLFEQAQGTGEMGPDTYDPDALKDITQDFESTNEMPETGKRPGSSVHTKSMDDEDGREHTRDMPPDA